MPPQKPPATQSDNKNNRKIWSWLVSWQSFRLTLMVVMSAILILVIAVIPWFDITESLGSSEGAYRLITISAGLIALGIAVWRSSSAERQVKSAVKGQYSDRFVKAVEQVADKQLAIRLGGLASLQALSLETAQEHIRVWTYLGDFLHWPPKLDIDPPSDDYKEGDPLGRRPDIAAIVDMIGNRSKQQRNWEEKEESMLPLHKAHLEGANLRSANLEGTNLEGAHLKEAHLEGARLEGAHLKEANLRGAHLRGVYLEGANLRGADLESAGLDQAVLGHVDLREANLLGAHLEGAHLVRANLRGANLLGAHLKGADLRGANLEGADLRGADLEGADLEGADLEGADLEGADLEGANLEGTDLEGTDLRGGHDVSHQ